MIVVDILCGKLSDVIRNRLTFRKNTNPWRGSLLPLGCVAVVTIVYPMVRVELIEAAAQPSGSKLPRHGF